MIEDRHGGFGPDALICAALRGEHPSWPSDADEGFGAQVIDAAVRHRVTGLLDACRASTADWPRAVRTELLVRAAAASLWEDRHRAALRRLVEEMERRSIPPVFIKGTALAYSRYTRPELRMRSDSDLLVPPEQRHGAHAALLAAGFEPEGPGGREVFVQQRAYSLTDEQGRSHPIDLHWQINNATMLSRLFPTGDVIARSVPLPALAPGARAAGDVDQVLLSCVHRELHGVFIERLSANGATPDGACRDPGNLIWLFDLRVMAGAMTGDAWERLVEAAFARGLAGICGTALMLARALLGAPCPDEVLIALSHAPRRERPAEYLAAPALARHWMDFLATEGARRKARFLREMLIPPGEYMRWLYPDRQSSPLPWLYLDRGVRRAIDRLAAALRH